MHALSAEPRTAPPPAELARPHRVPLRQLLLLYASSRLFIYAVAGLSLATVAKPKNFDAPHGLLNWFMRWDANWYLDVVQRGYWFVHSGHDTNVGYFPLLPLVTWLGSLGGILNPVAVGLAVGFVGFWAACPLLWRFVYDEWNDPNLATWSVALLLFSPVSFFFSNFYSESLFLPLTIGCLWAARRKHWWIAGGLGALAGLTRYVGIVMIVPLVTELVLDRHRSPIRIRSVLACLLPAAGYGAYCLFMWIKFGNPHMYAEAQLVSGRHFTWFWGLFTRESFTGLQWFYQMWFGGAVLIAFAFMLAGAFFRLPVSLTVFLLSFSFVYISARFVDSLPRYFAALFPFYIVLAMLCRRAPVIRIPLIAAMSILQAIAVTLFVNGYWFT